MPSGVAGDTVKPRERWSVLAQDLYILQGPFLAIFAMELGECNANINFCLKTMCGSTVPISNI